MLLKAYLLLYSLHRYTTLTVAESKSPVFVGCFSHKSQNLIDNWDTSGRTYEECSNIATEKEASWFVLESPQRYSRSGATSCGWGNELSRRYYTEDGPLPSDRCREMVDSANRPLGGAGAFAAYMFIKNPEPKSLNSPQKFKYIGCYSHISQKLIIHWRLSGTTIQECYEIARKSEYNWFVLEFPQGYASSGMSSCGWGGSYTNEGELSQSQCATERDHLGNFLGGSHAIAVYKVIE